MLSIHEKAERLEDGSYITRRFLLALATYREARSESRRGKKLVAQSVENRVNDSRWPDNYRDVILQPWQFSSFNKNDPQVNLFPPTHYDSTGNLQAWLVCWEVAGEVLDETEDISEGSNHYFANDIPAPDWADPDKLVTSEGVHEFYKL